MAEEKRAAADVVGFILGARCAARMVNEGAGDDFDVDDVTLFNDAADTPPVCLGARFLHACA